MHHLWIGSELDRNCATNFMTRVLPTIIDLALDVEKITTRLPLDMTTDRDPTSSTDDVNGKLKSCDEHAMLPFIFPGNFSDDAESYDHWT